MRRRSGLPKLMAELPLRMAVRIPKAASTTAYQTNFLAADMSQNVAAGIGGDGGNHNKAEGGDVHFKASIESVNLNDAFNNYEHYHIDDSGMFVHG
jgi:hypothetical protein